MADDPHNASDISEPSLATSAKEDAETTAARRELKQTSISEHSKTAAQEDLSGSDDDNVKGESAPAGRITPDTDAGDDKDDLRERVASPKKKRVHDELIADGTSTGEASSRPPITAVTQTRTEESGREKKRPRDGESERRKSQDGEEPGNSPPPSLDKTSEAKADTPKDTNGGKPAVTSKSAFAASGFAKLATTQSAFALAGSKPSVFGGGAASSGGFGSLGGSKPATSTAPKLTFGGPLGGASPFSLNGGKGTPSVFASPSPFGGFGGSVLSGSHSSFGKPGETFKSTKPAKPFGAPDSDAEESSDEREDGADDKEEEAGSDSGESKETGKDKDEPKTVADEEKKLRLRKVKVDDGESGDVTLLSLRAKLFVMEKAENGIPAGWKERGSGQLKVNVPSSSVELDDLGHADPSTFDASTFDESDSEESAPAKCVRLIMRQESTHRVILNTVILPAMSFKVTRGLKSATVLFTAFDNDGNAKPMQVKMTDANTTLFIDLTEMIKRQLADV